MYRRMGIRCETLRPTTTANHAISHTTEIISDVKNSIEFLNFEFEFEFLGQIQLNLNFLPREAWICRLKKMNLNLSSEKKWIWICCLKKKEFEFLDKNEFEFKFVYPTFWYAISLKKWSEKNIKFHKSMWFHEITRKISILRQQCMIQIHFDDFLFLNLNLK